METTKIGKLNWLIVNLNLDTFLNGDKIKKVDSGNLLRIKGQTGETLDGVDIFSSSWDVSVQYECITVVSNGLNWFII
jgi:hypothetical protein